MLPHMRLNPYDKIEAQLRVVGLKPREASMLASNNRNPDLIRNIKRGRSNFPRGEALNRLAEVLQKPVEWLIGLDEEMAEQSEENALYVAAGELWQPSIPGGTPELDARPGMGSGDPGMLVVTTSDGIQTGHLVRDEWVIPPNYTRHTLGSTPRATIILEVINDSMLPTLLPGDRVIVDTLARWTNDDSIWLINDDTPKVKRLRLVRNSDPLQVLIKSDNERISDEIVLLGDIQIIGRVCGKITRL